MIKNIDPKIVYPQNNGYVSDLKPTIQGTGEPGASINGNIDSIPFSASVSQNGVWSYKTETDLSNFTEHSIKVSQTCLEGQVSPQVTVNFKTDTQTLLPHALTFPVNNQFINTNSPVINGTGKPGATIEVNLLDSYYNTIVNQDGKWQVKTNNLPEGASFMNVVQKDMGNSSSPICSNFVVDTIAPSEPVVDFPYDLSCINNPMPVFNGKGEPNAAIDATVDDKKYYAQVNADGNWSFEISQALIDDTHILSTRQIDPAGNISPETISVFTVKTVQPGPPSVTNPVNGSIIAEAAPVITGYGEKDCVIVTRVYDSIYSALVNPDGTWELKIAEKLADGSHTLKIYQVDLAGNISGNIDLAIKIDTSIPAAPVILYPQKGKYVNKANFTIQGTGEPDATIVCSLAGKDHTTRVANDGSWSIDLSGDGSIKYKIDYIITAKQIDLAGNESRITKTEFAIDTDSLKAPMVAFPENNSFINTPNPLVTGKGKINATVNLNVNNKNYSTKVLSNETWAILVEESLAQGDNKITVTQTDFGNVSSSTVVCFYVKLSVPPCPIINKPMKNQTVNSENVLISGTGEAGAKINIKLDDSCFTVNVNDAGEWEYFATNLLQGIHSVLINQTDLPGNKSLYSHESFITSTEKPNISYSNGPTTYQIKYNPPGPELTSKTIATLKTSNPVTINDVFGNEFTMIISSNGLYDFKFSDSGGNSGCVTAGVTWIDNQAPIILIDSCGSYFSSDKIVSYYKYGGSCVKRALLNNTPFESGKRITEEGFYRIEVTDKAGNLATDCFIIDRTPPQVTGIENNMVYNTDVIVNYSDNLTGIKSAMLNGINVIQGTILKENGDYTLTVTDYADNIVEKCFSIRK